jgi:membrane protease YdiL (CAAX protease family)
MNTVSGASEESIPPYNLDRLDRGKRPSPYAVAMILAFFLMQSTLLSGLSTIGRHSHGKARQIPRIADESIPDSVTQGILTIDLDAKTSFVANPSIPAIARPLLEKTAKDAADKALRESQSLLLTNPDQPALARRVILLRAEIGAVDPLSPVIGKHGESVTPLAVFAEASSSSRSVRSQYTLETQVWSALFGGDARVFAGAKPVPISAAQASALAFEIRAMPNLRWWRNVALHQVYLHAHENLAAARVLHVIQRDATSSLAMSSLIDGGLVVALVIGLIAIVVLIATRSDSADRPPLLRTLPPIVDDHERKLTARSLFDFFALYLFLMLAVGLLAQFGLSRAIAHHAPMSSAMSVSVEIVAEAVLMLFCGGSAVVALAAYARSIGADFAKEIGLILGGQSVGRLLLFGFIGWSIALPLVLGVGELSRTLFHAAPSPANPAIPLLMSAPAGWISVLLYVLVAVIAPFFEETLFRGVFFNAARLMVGERWAIPLTGVVFGLAHPVGIAEQVPLAALGATFAWMALKRRSLVPTMFAHCLQNSLVYATLLFSLMQITPK